MESWAYWHSVMTFTRLLWIECKFKRSTHRHTHDARLKQYMNAKATITCRAWITIAGKPTALLVLYYLFTHVRSTDNLIHPTDTASTLTLSICLCSKNSARAYLIRRAFFFNSKERKKKSVSVRRQIETVDSNTKSHAQLHGRCVRFIFLHFWPNRKQLFNNRFSYMLAFVRQTCIFSFLWRPCATTTTATRVGFFFS